MKRNLIIIGVFAALALAVAVVVKLSDSSQERGSGAQSGYHYPSFTEIEVGFTNVRHNRHFPIKVVGDKWMPCVKKVGLRCTEAWYYHAVVIAKDPRREVDYYFRAGPSKDTGGSTSTGAPHSSSSSDCPSGTGLMCATAEQLTERSVDKITDILGRHSMGPVRVAFPQVVDRMNRFAESINLRDVPYHFTEYNSNTAASAFVADLGLDPNAIRNPTESFMFLPGWICDSQLNSVGKNSIFYPESKAGSCVL